MFNLIKMDMHRLIHSVSTWVLIIFSVLTAIFSIAMTNMDIQASKEEPAPIIEDASSEELVGIYVTGNPEWANGSIELGEVICMEIQSGLTAILCVIFAALFTCADYKNGFIKNIAGQYPRRGKLILSKFLAIAVQVFLLLFVFVAVTAAASFIFWGEKVYLASSLSLLKVLGVQYLLHLGVAAFIMLLSILTRSTAFSSTAGIVLCSGLTAYLYSGINQIVSTIKPSWDFNMNNYVLESNMKMIGLDTVPTTLLQGAVVGIIFIIASIAFAMLTIQKRDIR